MRLFVTVGSMLPFDRLVDAMGVWAAAHPSVMVRAQVARGGVAPHAMHCSELMTPQEFQAEVAAADVVVGHAGMGTVMAALEAGKPLVLLPRRHEAGEATNAHQIDTLKWLATKPGVVVAAREDELPLAIEMALRSREGVGDLAGAGGGSRHLLVAALRQFIQQS